MVGAAAAVAPARVLVCPKPVVPWLLLIPPPRFAPCAPDAEAPLLLLPAAADLLVPAYRGRLLFCRLRQLRLPHLLAPMRKGSM